MDTPAGILGTSEPVNENAPAKKPAKISVKRSLKSVVDHAVCVGYRRGTDDLELDFLSGEVVQTLRISADNLQITLITFEERLVKERKETSL